MKLKFNSEKQEDGLVIFNYDPHCENCCPMSPYEASIVRDGTNWCVICFNTWNKISEENMLTLKSLEKENKICYHEEELKRLKGE